MSKRLQQNVLYYFKVGGQMLKRPSDEIIKQFYPDMTEYDLQAYDFKSCYIRIAQVMDEENHPDAQLVYDYGMAEIFGGLAGDYEGNLREEHFGVVLISLRDHPEKRVPTWEEFLKQRNNLPIATT